MLQHQHTGLRLNTWTRDVSAPAGCGWSVALVTLLSLPINIIKTEISEEILLEHIRDSITQLCGYILICK